MGKWIPRFGTVARQIQANFKSFLGQEAQRPAADKGVWNPHLIATGEGMENRFPKIREPEAL